MNEYKKTIIPVIEANYDKFTDTEKVVADYFLSNVSPENIAANIVAKHISVSEATLSRFSQKCGYSGYREFSYEYKNAYIEKNSKNNPESIFVLNTYQNLLNKMYNLIDINQINSVSTYIKKTKNIYICGRGSSGLAAEEMTTRFRWLGVNTIAIRDNENMKIQSAFLSEKDCVIGISLSGTKSEILYMLEHGAKNGAKTILITERNRTEYKNICDEVILVPSIAKLNQGNIISPQFPILLIIDIIYAYYINLDRKKYEILQEKIQKYLNE